MPNHITNIIKINKKKDFKKVCEFIKGDENQLFDFNKIVPMPFELLKSQSPVKIISVEEFQKQDPNEKYGGGITLKMQQDYQERFGADNWYNWSINNWGTKWNAYEVVIEEKTNEIIFMTAWSTPEAVIEKLSRKFPTIIFSVKYADEDIGNNCGEYAFLNGDKFVDFEGDLKFACDVLDIDFEEYQKELLDNNN